MKVLNVVGARPNFIKVAPIVRAMKERGGFESLLVHTGQHYDANMSDAFFRDLDISSPDISLGVGSGSHAWQTAQIMMRFEKVVEEVGPDLVLVVGDVNSTLACALVAAKMYVNGGRRAVPVAHVEAGLRSFDRTMPEEVNRLLTDQLSDYLFTTCREAGENLRREGVPEEKIFFVGNVMVDTLLANLERARNSDILTHLGLEGGGYAVLTLHRPSNVDDRATFEHILAALEEIQEQIPIVFPAHPRTAARIEAGGLGEKLAAMPLFRLIAPLGYLDFLALMRSSRLVLTDSGGIQEETTVLSIPCLTLRENTERPVTIAEGTNTLVGTDPQRIVGEARKVLEGGEKRGRIPELWDGRAAGRIVEVLAGLEGQL